MERPDHGERRMLTRTHDEERGATAIIIAASLILLIGMAALALDYSAGMNERRQDQTAADFGALAGALFLVQGSPEIVEQVIDVVEQNLDTTYLAADYRASWENCVDPASERNAGGFNFVPLPPPDGWSVPTDWCISYDGELGLLRVRVPDQFVEAQFAGVIGTDQLTTNAVAVARVLNLTGSGGVLPFSLPGTAGGGEHLCLSSGPSGNSLDPCSGGSSGNFGTVRIRQFGNAALGTSPSCPNLSNPNRVLAQNIATGADHTLVTDADNSPSNEVRDYACDTPLPDTLQIDTSFPNNAAEVGLVGPVPGGFTPRLSQVTPAPEGSQATIFGFTIDDTPLWEYLLPNGSVDDKGTSDPTDDVTLTYGTNAPASCNPDSFASGPPSMDWNGDGFEDDLNMDTTADPRGSWLHMGICLRQYVGDWNFDGDTDDLVDVSPFNEVMINDVVLDNTARFGYVPQFYPTGAQGQWNRIQRFRAIYLQSTTWKLPPNNYVFQHPGELCTSCVGNGSLWQLTAFTLPDAALPVELRGDPLPGSNTLNPFKTELYR